MQRLAWDVGRSKEQGQDHRGLRQIHQHSTSTSTATQQHINTALSRSLVLITPQWHNATGPHPHLQGLTACTRRPAALSLDQSMPKDPGTR